MTRTPVITDTGYLPIIMRQNTPTPIPPTNTPTVATTLSPTPTETPIRTCLPNPPLSANNDGIESLLAIDINQERADNGSLAGFTKNDLLVQAARRHVINMSSLDDNQLNADPHEGTDGTGYVQRIEQACYDSNEVSEIVGWGHTTLEGMLDWWMRSDPHRENILSTSLDEYGPSYAKLDGTQYTHYWTVTFGNSTSNRSNDLVYHCTYTIVEEDRGMSVSMWQDKPCD
ncbi:MAG: CAP domain-containing protein [Chloroflexota bacterium]